MEMRARAMCLMFASILAPVAAYASYSDYLVAHYRLDGNATDSSPYANHGTIMGAVPGPDLCGNSGGALDLSGPSYVELGGVVKPQFPVTITAWINTRAFVHDVSQWIFCNDIQNGWTRYYGVGMTIRSEGWFEGFIGDGGPAAETARRNKRTLVPVLQANTWHHVAVVFRGLADMSLYVDGMEVDGYYFGTGGALAYSSNSGFIGIHGFYDGQTLANFNGYIDDVRVYAFGLSASDVWAIYQEGSCKMTGGIAGVVTVDCGAPTGGIELDLYALGNGELIDTAISRDDGSYEFDDVPVGDYVVTLVEPLGYGAAHNEELVSVVAGELEAADYAATCLTPSGSPRGIGYWKHQVAVGLGGPGRADIAPENLCSLLDLVEAHFNSNAINAVIVYAPPASGLCSEKLGAAAELLNMKGEQDAIWRARQQFIALLMNVADGRVSLFQAASEDGATVSQAITFIDQLIDSELADKGLAKDLAETLNRGELIEGGVVPREIGYIAYRGAGPSVPNGPTLLGNSPNPFNPATTLSFWLPAPSHVSIAIYDMIGRRVTELVNGTCGAGMQRVTWDGRNGSGLRVASGTYLAVMGCEGMVSQSKMLLLK